SVTKEGAENKRTEAAQTQKGHNLNKRIQLFIQMEEHIAKREGDIAEREAMLHGIMQDVARQRQILQKREKAVEKKEGFLLGLKTSALVEEQQTSAHGTKRLEISMLEEESGGYARNLQAKFEDVVKMNEDIEKRELELKENQIKLNLAVKRYEQHCKDFSDTANARERALNEREENMQAREKNCATALRQREEALRHSRLECEDIRQAYQSLLRN